MTNQLARLYAVVGSILAFFLTWAAVAAHPWAPRPAQDPRVAALAARQHRIQVESVRVRRIVDARWAAYRKKLAARNLASTRAQPSVRVVNLPPLVLTRSS